MIRWVHSLLVGSLGWTGFNGSTRAPRSVSAVLSPSAVRDIEAMGQRYDFPGIGIGLVALQEREGGESWHTEVLSLGHSDASKDHFTPDTMLQIASNSKLFTAVSIGLLIENATVLPNGNLLDYDTEVEDVLPHWSMIRPYMHHHVDLVDLLAMRTGIPSHYGTHVKKNATEMVQQFRHLRASCEIRQTMQYNDYHYWVLAEIVAELSGLSIIEYVQTHIWDRLNMTTTTYNHTEAAETGRMAAGYEREGRNLKTCQDILQKEGRVDVSCHGNSSQIEWFVEGDGMFYAGPAGVAISYRDMLKWLRELLCPSILPLKRIAKTHESLIPAFSHTTLFDEVSTLSYGHAQMTFNYRGHEVILHHGTHPGAASLVVRVPALETGLFVTTTELTLGETFNFIILYRILDDLLKLDPIDWTGRLYTPQLMKKFAATEPPESPRSGPKREDIQGLYHDEAYGLLNITRIDVIDSRMPGFDVAFASYMGFDEVSNANTSVSSTQATYFASLPNVYYRGLWLDHFDGPLYNATALGLRQKVDGGVIPVSYGTFTAVIVGGEGLGMFGNFWAGEKGRDPVEEAVSTYAEVWFNKLPMPNQ